MKIKGLLAVALTFALLLSLASCGQTEAPGDATGSAENTTEAIDDGKVTYTVKVMDEGGNPIAQAGVKMCQSDSCLLGMTDTEGVATFRALEETDYEVSFTAMPTGYEAEETEFYFENGSYEMTIALKAVA